MPSKARIVVAARPLPRSRDDWHDEDEDDEDESDPASQNLFDLTLLFIRYAHHVEGVPLTKAEMARREIYDFITRRQTGKLEYREGMLDSALRSAGKREPIKKYKPYEHLLCPDPERLDTCTGARYAQLSAPQCGGADGVVPGLDAFSADPGIG